MAAGDVARVGVVGCGLMGSGITEAAARAGLEVHVVERDAGALAAGRTRVETSVQRAVKAGKLADEDAERALARMTFATELEALADVDLVVEAVVESEPEKVEVFALLDRVVAAPDAVLASNTSSIPIMKLAMATSRPSQVLGIRSE
ncbi:MAG: 3-hydroxyacyl-CoA dehydrogenase NAD-binding domain-containing protein, partial [Actinomycetota bacterium]|nr:3-hydroxyacyl-CoA dehydrogenase NAD-binding domain-containing protein [Actinomycetota bacterium]